MSKHSIALDISSLRRRLQVLKFDLKLAVCDVEKEIAILAELAECENEIRSLKDEYKFL